MLNVRVGESATGRLCKRQGYFRLAWPTGNGPTSSGRDNRKTALTHCSRRKLYFESYTVYRYGVGVAQLVQMGIAYCSGCSRRSTNVDDRAGFTLSELDHRWDKLSRVLVLRAVPEFCVSVAYQRPSGSRSFSLVSPVWVPDIRYPTLWSHTAVIPEVDDTLQSTNRLIQKTSKHSHHSSPS